MQRMLGSRDPRINKESFERMKAQYYAHFDEDKARVTQQLNGYLNEDSIMAKAVLRAREDTSDKADTESEVKDEPFDVPEMFELDF